MISALNSALSGMRMFAARFDDAAQEITGAGLKAASVPDDAPASQPVSALLNLSAPLPEPDLLRGVVNLKQAEIGYKASARLAGAVSSMHKHLLDMLR